MIECFDKLFIEVISPSLSASLQLISTQCFVQLLPNRSCESFSAFSLISMAPFFFLLPLAKQTKTDKTCQVVAWLTAGEVQREFQPRRYARTRRLQCIAAPPRYGSATVQQTSAIPSVNRMDARLLSVSVTHKPLPPSRAYTQMVSGRKKQNKTTDKRNRLGVRRCGVWHAGMHRAWQVQSMRQTVAALPTTSHRIRHLC